MRQFGAYLTNKINTDNNTGNNDQVYKSAINLIDFIKTQFFDPHGGPELCVIYVAHSIPFSDCGNDIALPVNPGRMRVHLLGALEAPAQIANALTVNLSTWDSFGPQFVTIILSPLRV